MVTFQVFTIDKGGGRTPTILNVIRGNISTRSEALAIAAERRQEFKGIGGISVNVRETPEVQPPSTFEFEGREFSGEFVAAPPRGRRTTRSPKEETRVIAKARELTLTNQAKRRELTQKEFVELRTLKRLRTGTTATFAPGAGLKGSPEVISTAELERQKAEARGERVGRLRERQRLLGIPAATVTVGERETEVSLGLRPSGAVVSLEARQEGQLSDVLTGFGAPFILPEVTFKDKPSLLQRADIKFRGVSKEPRETVTFLEGLQQTFPENKFIGRLGDISKTGEEISGEFIAGFGLKDRPVTLGAFGAVGFTFGVGSKLLQTFSLGRKVSKVGGGVLIGGAIGTTAAEVSLAEGAGAKARVLGRTTADFIAFGAGFGAGSQTFAIARRPRFVDIDLTAGRIRTITQVDGTFRVREFDISGISRFLERGKRPKEPPVVEDAPTGVTLKIGKPVPRTFFTAGDVLPSTLIKQGKGVFAFPTKELAAGRVLAEGEGKVFEIQSTRFERDPRMGTAIFRPVPDPTTPKETKQIPSLDEFFLKDIVSEKVVSPKPTAKQKATAAAVGITTTVLGSELFLPSLQIGTSTALGGLDIGAVAFVAGRSMRVTKRGKSVPRRRTERPSVKSRTPQEIRQLPQKQAARKSRIVRLQKEQQQIQFQRLFQETRVLKKGKKRIIEIQQFQPFIELAKGSKGGIVQTLTKVPKGSLTRIASEKGKPLIIKERLGRIEIGQRKLPEQKKLITLGKKGITGITDIPTGKKAFPKGFGAQIDMPTGDINKLVQVTKGSIAIKQLPKGLPEPKVPKKRQPIIKRDIGDPAPELLQKNIASDQLPKLTEPQKELRGGFRRGVKEKLVRRIQQREAERRLEMELKGEVGVAPGQFGIPEALSGRTAGIIGVFGPKKKRKGKIILTEEESFLRGIQPVVRRDVPTVAQSLTDIRFVRGPLGPARRIIPRKLSVAGDIAVGKDFRQREAPKLGFDVGVRPSTTVTQALGVGLLLGQEQLQVQQQIAALDVRTDVIQQQIPIVVPDVGVAQRQIPAVDSILATSPILDLVPPPPVPPRTPRAPRPPRGPPLLPPTLPPQVPPPVPPRRPPRRPPRLPPRPPIKPPVLPPLIPLLRAGRLRKVERPVRKEERRRRFRGTPSLSVVLGGAGQILTPAQLAGRAAISPLAIRAIPNRRRI